MGEAIKPDWKTSLIPQDAGNATDPVVADAKEIEGIIANPISLKLPQPIDQELNPVPRYNATVPYSPQKTSYTQSDEKLMEAIQKAIKNGWKDAHRWANGSVTIGMEAEAVVSSMKKRGIKAEELLLDDDFVKALYG